MRRRKCVATKKKKKCFPDAEGWNRSSIINSTWKRQWQTDCVFVFVFCFFFSTLPEMDSGCCSSSLLCRLHERAALWHSYPAEERVKKQTNIKIKALMRCLNKNTTLTPFNSPTLWSFQWHYQKKKKKKSAEQELITDIPALTNTTSTTYMRNGSFTRW